MQLHSEAIGSPPEKCTTAATTPAAAGMGMPTKYFFPGRPGFEGCGLLVILNRARRLAPAMRNRKLAIAPNCVNLICHSVSNTVGIRLNPQLHASMAGAT